MNCRSAESLFSAFLDDELNQKERRGLEAHLLSCKRCSMSVRELRASLQLLDALPHVETSPHFEDDVMARIRSGEAMRPSMVEWLRRRFEPAALRPLFLAGAGACAVWIAVTIAQNPDAYDFFRGGSNAVANRAQPAPAAVPSTGPGVASTDAASGGAPAAASSDVVAHAGSPSGTTARSSAPGASRSPAAGPAADVASLNRGLVSDEPSNDAAVPNPGSRYVDEYITDQFYLERQVDGADPGITPVSGRVSDDGYITF
jgi:anti-sigma factor RsiW